MINEMLKMKFKITNYNVIVAIIIFSTGTCGAINKRILHESIKPELIEHESIKPELIEHKPIGNIYAGISAKEFEPPRLVPGSKVLDVGAGDGVITKKLIDMVGHEHVWALEPDHEEFKKLQAHAGDSPHFKQMTLQEAVERYPDQYRNAFDVITVFKYDVPILQTDDFLRALCQAIRPGGTVIMTAVAFYRFLPNYLNPLAIGLNILNFFNIEKREIVKGTSSGVKVTAPLYEILYLKKGRC